MPEFTPERSHDIVIYGEKPVEKEVKLDFYDIRVEYKEKIYSLLRKREKVTVKYGDEFILYVDIVNYGELCCTPEVKIEDLETGRIIFDQIADTVLCYYEGYTFKAKFTMPEKPEWKLRIHIGYIWAGEREEYPGLEKIIGRA